ncbi:MAG: transposase [Candidatus Paceibacterota bacterium]
MSRNYVFAPGEYYHLYSRGAEKVKTYRQESDYRRFKEGLYLHNTEQSVNIRDAKKALSLGLTSGGSLYETERGESIVDIGAYCLMPNHFHLLVREKVDGGISKFMQKLMTSYTMFINKKYERTGALFGSSFKARHILDDSHLKYLFAYIHLNPREIVGNDLKLEDYQHSSYPDYVDMGRPEEAILSKGSFPDYFSGAMNKEIKEWLDYEDTC